MLKQSVRAVGNLFLKQVCPFCDRATPLALCDNCWQQLQRSAHPPATESSPEALPVLAWGAYQGQLKQAIAALKYHNNPQLAVPLGRALGQRWQQLPLTTRRTPLVVPIPMHAEKQRERGFNQAELLAIAFCDQTGLQLVKQGLTRQRSTVPQFGLGPEARQQNLAGAFALGKTFQQRRPQQPVLLLDDIYTTGTTVKVAAAELRRCGISVCGVAAIARATLDT